MTFKLLTLATAAVIALAPVAALSQTSATPQAGAKVLKQTNPKKNGTSQSESLNGANKNGRPQHHAKMSGKIQKQTNPKKNGRSQSESVNGANKNGQPQTK